MLAGLFFAGLMAAVITPILMDADMEEDEDVMEPEIDDVSRDVGNIDAGMEAEPVFHEFDDVSGEHVLDGFRPGVDRLSVTLDSWELDLTEVTAGEHGPALHFGSFNDSTILMFPGLATIPSADIDLVIAEPDAEPVTITLAEASEAISGIGDDVLQPIDPETPDAELGAGLELDPIVPTAPDTPDDTAIEPVLGTPLQPILDDDPVSEPDAEPVTVTLAEASEANPGIGDDVLQPIDPETPDAEPGAGLELDPIVPTAPDTPDDTAIEPVLGTPLQPVLDDDPVPEPTAAEGAQTVFLASPDWHEGTDASVFQDFDPKEHILSIEVDVVPGSKPPVIGVAPSANGADGVIKVNGQTVAVLPGAAGVTENDVLVKIRGLNAA